MLAAHHFQPCIVAKTYLLVFSNEVQACCSIVGLLPTMLRQGWCSQALVSAGDAIRGLGSPHTPAGFIWPLSLMAQGLTSPDPAARANLFRQLLKMQCGNGLMHESVNMHELSSCTRPWFEWANAMLVVLVENSLGISCEAAAVKHRLDKIKVGNCHNNLNAPECQT